MIELIPWDTLSTDALMQAKWYPSNILDMPFDTSIYDKLGKVITNHNSISIVSNRASFNGSNQYLEFSNDAVFQFWNADFVFETLYKPTDIPSGEGYPNRHALYHDGPDSSVSQNGIYVTKTKLEVGISDSTKILSLTHNFTAGVEYKIQLTRVSGIWTFYKDDVSLGNNSFPSTSIPTYTNSKTIGCEERGAGDFLKGTLGSYRITNEPLNSEIAVHSESTIIADYDYALKLVISSSALNQFKRSLFVPSINLSGQVTFKTKIAASRTGQNIKISLINGGTGGDNTQTDFTPNIQSAGTSYIEYSFDISGVADSAKNAISQIKITVLNADDSNTVYIGSFSTLSENEGTGGVSGYPRSRILGG